MMLILPDSGFQPSIRKHNVDLNILADWIEASVVFIDNVVSQSDVVDALCENGVYREQDFAAVIVSDAWEELERRKNAGAGGVSFEIDGRRVSRTADWQEVPTYSFCLVATLQVLYKNWAMQFGDNYTVQGDLFERITIACLSALGWSTLRAGWAPGETAKIREVVSSVASHISEAEIPGELEKWVSDNANDEGLDVVCSDPFSDGWGGRPLFFFQCASGANWDHKLHTPDPDVWRRVISFTTIPQRSFAMPFALLEDDFRRVAGRVGGMLLDRYRLLAASDEDCLPRQLTRDILRWVRPRVRALPSDKL